MRTLNRAVSVALALLLLVGGLVLAAEIVSGFIGREEPLLLPWDRWYDDARSTPWSDPDLRAWMLLVLAVGVALLLLQLVSRRPQAFPLATEDDRSHAELDRRGLERWLSKKVEDVDGVASARAKVRRGGATVVAETAGRETDRVRASLQHAAGSALDELQLASPMPVKVKVSSRRGDL